MIPPSGEQITITAGDQQAVIVEVGGGLRSYSVGGRELVDGYRADEMSSSGRGQVLIPWPNRLQDGSYEFDGRRHQLPLNEPERRNAIHGLVRWATWTAAERESHGSRGALPTDSRAVAGRICGGRSGDCRCLYLPHAAELRHRSGAGRGRRRRIGLSFCFWH